MYAGQIDKLGLAIHLPKYLQQILQQCWQHWLQHPEQQKVAIDGEAVFYAVLQDETVSMDKKRFEAHQDYLDIHVVIEGAESIGYALKSVNINDYEHEMDDLYFGEASHTQCITLLPKEYVVFFPLTSHKPMCHLENEKAGHLKKMIIKVHRDRLVG